MGLTGIFFAVAAVAWLTYGVPQFLSTTRTPDEEEQGSEASLTEAVRILRPARPGSALTEVTARTPSVPLLGVDGEQFGHAELSTSFTRRSELRRLRKIENAAIRIRRAVLALTMAGEALLVICALNGWVPWWSLGLGGAGLVAVLAGLRGSVVMVDREIDRRVARLRAGNEERTLAISRGELLPMGQSREAAAVEAPVTSRSVVSTSVPLVDDIPSPEVAPSLWEPLPVPEPTYVQRPITARTVRTIDLSSPDLNAAMDRAQGDLPVTAEAHDRETAVAGSPGATRSRRPRLRAVGE